MIDGTKGFRKAGIAAMNTERPKPERRPTMIDADKIRQMTDEEIADFLSNVVSAKEYNRLLSAARKMHTWIFLNSADEQEAYDQCGLTDEENALLGYGGRFEIVVDKESTNDVKDRPV